MTGFIPPHIRAMMAAAGKAPASREPGEVAPTGFHRDFVVPKTAPIMVREGVIADWADIWPFFRKVLAAGEKFCLPNLMLGSDARTLWFGGRDTSVIVAVDPREKPTVINADSPIVGKVVGSASLRSARDGYGRHVAAVAFVADPGHDGEGIERELTISILTRAHAAGFTALEIEPVVETDEAVIAVWESLGFAVVGRRPGAFEHPSAGPVALLTLYRRL